MKFFRPRACDLCASKSEAMYVYGCAGCEDRIWKRDMKLDLRMQAKEKQDKEDLLNKSVDNAWEMNR